jgi:hypothetical protein
VKRLTPHRTWSAYVLAAAVIVAAPAIMVSQTGRANEPWNDPWSGHWPALLDRPVTVDPGLAALQRRIDASLERMTTAGSEPTPPSTLHTDAGETPRWFPSQIAEREPGREP